MIEDYSEYFSAGIIVTVSWKVCVMIASKNTFFTFDNLDFVDYLKTKNKTNRSFDCWLH